MGDFPIGNRSMEYACAAAMSAVPTDLRNLSVGGRTFRQLVLDAVYAAAPHVGAATLLDHADGLSSVEEPNPLSPEWDLWVEAQQLRVHASEVLAWAEEHEADDEDDDAGDDDEDDHQLALVGPCRIEDLDTQVIPIIPTQRASAWFSTRAC